MPKFTGVARRPPGFWRCRWRCVAPRAPTLHSAGKGPVHPRPTKNPRVSLDGGRSWTQSESSLAYTCCMAARQERNIWRCRRLSPYRASCLTHEPTEPARTVARPRMLLWAAVAIHTGFDGLLVRGNHIASRWAGPRNCKSPEFADNGTMVGMCHRCRLDIDLAEPAPMKFG